MTSRVFDERRRHAVWRMCLICANPSPLLLPLITPRHYPAVHPDVPSVVYSKANGMFACMWFVCNRTVPCASVYIFLRSQFFFRSPAYDFPSIGITTMRSFLLRRHHGGNTSRVFRLTLIDRRQYLRSGCRQSLHTHTHIHARMHIRRAQTKDVFSSVSTIVPPRTLPMHLSW